MELSEILKNFQQPTPKYGRFTLDKSEAEKFSKDLRNSIYESFDSQKFKTYGRVVQGTEGQSRNFFQISLINDFMIAEDNKFIECMNKLGNSDDINILTGEEQAVIRKYHPYSWEFFTGRITSKEDSKFLRELDEEWIEVQLFKSSPDNVAKNENSIIVKGTLYFSASPPIETDSTLVVTDIKSNVDIPTDQMWQNIKNYTNVETFEKVKKAWKHDSELVKQPEITVLNVGQGNCITIKIPNKMRLFFDAGLSIYKQDFEENYISATKKYLSQSMPDWIILSHWDMDHIKGYPLLKVMKNMM